MKKNNLITDEEIKKLYQSEKNRTALKIGTAFEDTQNEYEGFRNQDNN